MENRRVRSIDEAKVLEEAGTIAESVRRAVRTGPDRGFWGPEAVNDGDVRKIAIALGVIEAVSHHEAVGNLEAHVIHRHVDRASRGFA